MRCKVFTLVCAVVIVVIGISYFSFQAEAAFTNPLNISFNFPLTPSAADPFRIGGSGVEQVFRTGSVPSAGVFANLDPKNGVAPAGTSLQFFSGNSGTIGSNDFVYAMKVTNRSDSTLPLSTFQSGSCNNAQITSIGYVRDTTGSVFNPNTGTYFAALGQLFFTFEDANVIPTGRESTILFFTSPHPPSLATAFIGGGAGADSVSANVDPSTRLYTPCQVSLTVDKKIGCTPATVSDNPLTAVIGSPITYQISVRNNGSTRVSNIVINDPLLGGDITSSFTVGGNPFTGILLAGQTAIATIPATATANTNNIVTTSGEYLILTQQGTPTGQTLPLAEVPTAKLTDNTSLTVLPPPNLQATATIAPTSFTSLPQTLTYTVKATNNGSSSLNTVLDVDAKLKGILASPPAGLTIIPPTTFPTAAQTIAAGGMAQVQFSITVQTAAGWAALADAGFAQASFMMTATGTLTDSTVATCGTKTIIANSSAATSFTPPCSINLEKTVACDAGAGVPPDAAFSTSANVYPNSKVYYRYKVTNPNFFATISNITITDPSVSANPINVGTLTAGQMSVINQLVTITQPIGPIAGTATVNGTCDGGNVSAQSSTTVNVVNPTITAQKLVNGGTQITDYQLGTELKFTLNATNAATSGTPLNITIDDPLLRTIPGIVVKNGNTNVSLPFTFNSVAPGQTVSLMASVTFNTEQEFRAISDANFVLKNTMQASAALPGGVASCSLGATIPPLIISSDVTIKYNPPTFPDICIIRECEPNCPPLFPGQPNLTSVIPSTVIPGSLLVYNIHTSNLTATQDTGLTLTNAGPSTVFVHLFLVDGRTCTVADFFACLSPAQTSFWLSSELDPGVTGYIVGVATDHNGLPISYNYLRGTSKVKFSSGHAADLPALSFSALFPDRTILPGVNLSSVEADLKLDGLSYSLAPQMLAVSNLASPVDGNSSLLILNPVGGNLNSSNAVNLLTGLTGQVIDDKEKGYSFALSAQTCQIREFFRDGYPRIPTGLSKVIPSGTSGFVRFSETNGTPMMGSIINFNPNVGSSIRAFNQGHNLHNLTYTNKGFYRIPILRPDF